MSRPAVSVFRAERRKLAAQAPVRVLALVCLLGPFAFSLVLRGQSGVPADTLLGAWAHSSGFAVSFVVLGFAGYVGFPVLAGVLAGDLFSCEDRYETWKTTLTRSRSRSQVFAGKVLAAGAFSLGLCALAALSSLAGGLLMVGDQPLVGLAGNLMPAGECLWLASASWLLDAPALLGFASLAILLSVASRNGIVGVLGPALSALAMQLVALGGTGGWVHALLLTSAFDGWHGLLAAPRFHAPLLIALAVSLAWTATCLLAAWLILRRREFAGPAVGSGARTGWAMPLRTVLAALAALVMLALAAGLGPASITHARLEASIATAFGRLTLLQQHELGRPVSRAATLKLHTRCRRRAGADSGPGDDWSCTLTVLTPRAGADPFQLTPVIYDVSVKSNGCYKADAPPSFVGQQTMTDARGRSVVNPLFTIYGCFDTTASTRSSAQAPAPAPRSTRKGTGGAPGSAREREARALREAERTAGPAVVGEIERVERQQERAAGRAVEEEPPGGTSK